MVSNDNDRQHVAVQSRSGRFDQGLRPLRPYLTYDIRMAFPADTRVSRNHIVRNLHKLMYYWRAIGHSVVFEFLPENPFTTRVEPAPVAEVQETNETENMAFENGDPVANHDESVAENGGVEEMDIQHRGRLFPGVSRFTENVVGAFLMIFGYAWIAQMVDPRLLDKIFNVFFILGLFNLF